MLLDKWSSFAIAKTEEKTPMTNESRVLVVCKFKWVKLKQHFMNDVLDTHGVIKLVLRKISPTSVWKCSTYLNESNI